MPNEYTTLDEVRRYLTLASSNTSDDELLTRFMGRASRAIDAYCRKRRFYPRVETRFYNLGAESKLVMLDDDLLALTALSTTNGASTIASQLVFLGTGESWNHPPYDRLEIDFSSGSVLSYSGTPQRATRVRGTWGYHEDWDNAWVDTGTSLATSYAASGITLELAGAGSQGAGASDIFLESPRISVGHLLKVDNEYFHTLGAGGSGAGAVRVQPYANGTTGASHAASTVVYKFAPEPDIAWSAMRLTAWLYGQKDSPYNTRQAFVNLGTIEIPDALARDIKDKIDRFQRRTMKFFP